MRAVVDTNLLISGLMSFDGVPSQLLDAWRAGEYVGILSPQLIDEYRAVLLQPHLAVRFKMTGRQLTEFIDGILSVSERVEITSIEPVGVRDPNDEILIATAIAGNADVIVSGDRDLLEFDTGAIDAAIQIVTAVTFLKHLKGAAG